MGMGAQELKDVVAKHGKWLRGENDGSRANLSGADLSGADLSRANLYGADLSRANLSRANLSGADLSRANLRETLLAGKIIMSFQFQKHVAHFIGDGKIQIGCHSHAVDYWMENFKSIGQKEGYSEDEIEQYGRFIRGCAKAQAAIDAKQVTK